MIDAVLDLAALEGLLEKATAINLNAVWTQANSNGFRLTTDGETMFAVVKAFVNALPALIQAARGRDELRTDVARFKREANTDNINDQLDKLGLRFAVSAGQYIPLTDQYHAQIQHLRKEFQEAAFDTYCTIALPYRTRAEAAESRARQLEARAERMAGALRPFAKAAEGYDALEKPEADELFINGLVSSFPGYFANIQVGNLRAARSALADHAALTGAPASGLTGAVFGVPQEEAKPHE